MGARTGQEFLQSLRDGRRIMIDGEPVADVTRDKRFAGAAHTIAELLDMQHGAQRDALTYTSPTTGDRVGIGHMQPRNAEELARRRVGLQTWAEATYGMMGRSPDFMNVMISALGAAHPFFEKARTGCGDNIRRYAEHCRENDVVMTHVLVNPQVDRSRSVEKQEKDLAAKVVKEDDKGIYISGARTVSTLASFSNEVLVFPSTYLTPSPEAADYAFGCGMPVNTPGVTWISRPTILPGADASYADFPLSNRMDETDAVVVFEKAFVPWERVFLYRNVEACNQVYPKTLSGPHAATQSAVRALAKTEFMLSLALKIARSTKIDEHLHVQGMLSEIIVFRETLKAVITASEAGATMSPFGTLVPDANALWVVRMGFPKMFIRMQEIIQLLGASGLVAVPSFAELTGSAGDLVQRYYQSANSDAVERVKLFRLAFDACMSTFAGRQQLYERYYTGDPVRLAGMLFNIYDKKPFHQRMDAILEDIGERAAVWPDFPSVLPAESGQRLESIAA
jgi:4-hydroxyphenylacetate 3-monooxygenase